MKKKSVTILRLIDKVFNNYTKAYFKRIAKYYANKYKVTVSFEKATANTYTHVTKRGRRIVLGYGTYPAAKQIPLKYKIPYVQAKLTAKDVARTYKGLLLHEIAHNYYTDMKTNDIFCKAMYKSKRKLLTTLFRKLSNVIEDIAIEQEFAFNYPSTKKYFGYVLDIAVPSEEVMSDDELMGLLYEQAKGNPVPLLLSFLLAKFRRRDTLIGVPIYNEHKKFFDDAMSTCTQELDSTLRLKKSLAFGFEVAKLLIEHTDPDIGAVYKGTTPEELRQLVPPKPEDDAEVTSSSDYDSDLLVDSDKESKGETDGTEDKDDKHDDPRTDSEDGDSDTETLEDLEDSSEDDADEDTTTSRDTLDDESVDTEGTEALETDSELLEEGEDGDDRRDSVDELDDDGRPSESEDVPKGDEGTEGSKTTGSKKTDDEQPYLYNPDGSPVFEEEVELAEEEILDAATDMGDSEIDSGVEDTKMSEAPIDESEAQDIEDYDTVNDETLSKIVERTYGDDFGNIDQFTHNFYRIADYVDSRRNEIALDLYRQDLRKVQDMYEDIVSVFFDKMANRYEKWANNLYSGKLNKRDIMNENKANIFRRKLERTKKYDVDFMFVIDESGSMSGGRAKLAGLALIAIAEALSEIAGKFSIYSFTGDDYRTADTHEFKSFDDNFEDCKHYLSLYTHEAMPGTINNFSGNCDEINLDFLHEKFITESLATHKVMIVLSDGQTTNSRAMLQQVAKEIEDDGIEVYSIGIYTNEVERIYTNAVAIYDLDELPEALFEIVDKNLLS